MSTDKLIALGWIEIQPCVFVFRLRSGNLCVSFKMCRNDLFNFPGTEEEYTNAVKKRVLTRLEEEQAKERK